MLQAMARLIVPILLASVMSVSGEEAGCSAAGEGSSCAASGPSMVQMKSKRAKKHVTTKKTCDSGKTVKVLVHYNNEDGKQHTKDLDGNAEDLSSLNMEIVTLNECQKDELEEDQNVQVSEDFRAHVFVHRRGKAYQKREEERPYGIDLVTANFSAGGHEVKVCVIDTGYQLDHEDLPKEGVVGDKPGSYDGSWSVDPNGHGSHCAGTIGAIGGNHKGVVGVLGDPTKFKFHIGKGLEDTGGGSFSGVMQMVDKCIQAGAKVISMSLGGGGHSSAHEEAYKQAYDNGVLIIAAAGNGGNPSYSYPASYPSVMSVAAIDSAMTKAGFSQWNSQVEISAPGVQVESAVGDGGYAKWDGTSMATPHVAGVAALVWSHHPACTNHQIRGALISTATDLGPSGCDNKFGFGLVNAWKAHQLLETGGCSAGGEAQYSDSPGGCAQEGHHAPTPPPTPAPSCLDTNPCGVTVTVKTDKYPEETSWKILGADGSTVEGYPVNQIEQGGLEDKKTVHSWTVCFDGPGPREFKIRDKYKDGICCGYGQGRWKVSDAAGNELASGAEFAEFDGTPLNVECAADPTPAPTPPPTMAPTPPPTMAPTMAPTPPPTMAPTPPPTEAPVCDGSCNSREFALKFEPNFATDSGEDVWKLRNEQGDVVASGSGFLAGESVRTHTECIGGGSYTFEVFGYGALNFELKLNGEEVGHGTGGNYASIPINAC